MNTYKGNIILLTIVSILSVVSLYVLAEMHLISVNLIYVSTILTLLIESILALTLMKQRKHMNLLKHSDDDDEHKQYLKLRCHTGMIMKWIFVVSLLNVALITFMNQMSIIAIVGMILPFVLHQFISIWNAKTIYKDNSTPHAPNQGSPLLAIDEGERYMSLKSLLTTYVISIIALVMGIAVLTIYSITTHNNQSFSILIMIIVYALITLSYSSNISKSYREM
ncbi:DUF3169 family protein [Staphylococcus massiliensis]|uniref:DUF3169 family protein n=1 Tax=Staphylococcus massiliensis S46 TaxID=1229783 RepID=K9B080_9STAP|nr:DUF3169 family protein [Staphylococcus massiliensis]EKU48217.1 hypothetical protein C273_05907 [Staphylococcus massiliensis S46]MCG3399521.1 DUF3169 family protein [Staphylococcus massiliensis]MCG3412741.1 DUF3169 family protein [Staphylococcus massiliensis]PNZ97920.1 DUF3169 domain-containing protein [Staphylococcus massiliensis CCUG 55927]